MIQEDVLLDYITDNIKSHLCADDYNDPVNKENIDWIMDRRYSMITVDYHMNMTPMLINLWNLDDVKDAELTTHDGAWTVKDAPMSSHCWLDVEMKPRLLEVTLECKDFSIDYDTLTKTILTGYRVQIIKNLLYEMKQFYTM